MPNEKWDLLTRDEKDLILGVLNQASIANVRIAKAYDAVLDYTGRHPDRADAMADVTDADGFAIVSWHCVPKYLLDEMAPHFVAGERFEPSWVSIVAGSVKRSTILPIARRIKLGVFDHIAELVALTSVNSGPPGLPMALKAIETISGELQRHFYEGIKQMEEVLRRIMEPTGQEDLLASVSAADPVDEKDVN
jgi:hypothetical protein